MNYDSNIEKETDEVIDKINTEKHCLVAVVENEDEDTIEEEIFTINEMAEASDWYWKNEWRSDVNILYVCKQILQEGGTI